MRVFKIVFVFMMVLNSCNQKDSLVKEIDNELVISYEKGLFSKTMMEMDLTQPLNFDSFKAQMIANSTYPNQLKKSFGELENNIRIPNLYASNYIHNARGSSESLIVLDQIFEENEFSELGKSYFQRMVNIIPEENAEQELNSIDQIYDGLGAIVEEFNHDSSLEENEIEALNKASLFFKGEIEGLVEYVDESLITDDEAARCRFFCKVWRGVKSIVTVAVAGTIASVVITFGGSLAAWPAVAATFGFYAIVEMAFNNNCAGKFSCPTTWYNCSTGECL